MKSTNPYYKKTGLAFVVPNKARQPYKYNSYKNKVTKKSTSSLNKSNALSKAGMLLKNFERVINDPRGRLLLTVVSNGISSLANNSQDKLPAYVSDSVSNFRVGEDVTRKHTIRFHVGLESTVSIRESESQHGSVNIQLSNSLSENVDTNSRQQLSKSFGFNQKTFDFLNNAFHVTVRDYEKVYGISEWNIPEHSKQVPYGLVKEEFSSVLLRNSDSYNKMKVIFHIVKILDDDLSSRDLFYKVFNKKSDTQDTGKIPCVYQISDTYDISNTNMISSVLCFQGVGLNNSSNFKTQAKVVKRFYKQLNPGDSVNLKIVHHCGPGIRFDIAKSFLENGCKGLQPSSYFVVTEVIGTPCQAIRKSDKSSFQGTSPGWYNYEFSKGIKVIRNSTIVSKQSELIEKIDRRYAVKIHEREFLEKPPLNVNVSDIGGPDDDKSFMVLSLSSERTVYAHNIANEDNQTNIGENFKEIEQDFDEDFEESFEDEEDDNDEYEIDELGTFRRYKK